MRREQHPGPSPAAGGPHLPDELDLTRKATRRRAAQLVSILVLVVILVAFVVENARRVKIHFVFFSKDVRPIWLMLTCAILGGVVGYLVGRPGKQVGRPGKHEERAKGDSKQSRD